MGEPLVNGEKPHSQFLSVSFTPTEDKFDI